MKSFKYVLVLMFFIVLLISCSNKIDNKKQYVVAYISEPTRPLIPADTYESEGNKIIKLLFSGLFSYNDKGKMIHEIAKSVHTKDNKHYIIKLKNSFKFSDGSKVTAHNFVNAWNYAVKEKFVLKDFFSEIQGYPQSGQDFKQLSGLKVIDDYTFTIDLKYPVYDFIKRLGYVAFYPMHDSAFKDIDSYGQYPIGNGPYKLSSKNSWQHNINITLIPNGYYKGNRKVKNKGIVFKVYSLLSAAYADLLSGQLDVLESIPIEQLNSYHKDLDKRFIDNNLAAITYLSIDVNTPHFMMDKEGMLRRQAISMAINKEEIIKIIFYNTRKPAKDFTSTYFTEYRPLPKDILVLEFNPKKAKQFWDEADKISKFDDVFTISYNADAGHQEWIEAICNQLKNNLKIQVVTNPYPDFKSFLTDVREKKIKYAFREGWQADYPSVSTFLSKYLSSASSGINSTSYNNAKFDELFSKAIQSNNLKQYEYYIKLCQEILLEDLPQIPLFYSMINLGFSKNVKDVKLGWGSFPLYYNIIKK